MAFGAVWQRDGATSPPPPFTATDALTACSRSSAPARDLLRVGQARNRIQAAAACTVPFVLYCCTITVLR
ncbi:hypothetical protein OHA98_39405 [Streptomyces sp. NBC_00654]|uniref:hypothetical protein n=1 Tax=Streptomyces sp. NBC_00654 TaxID=2975799 RepID=UPI00224ED8DD|nr:hypothetical protein [Streptomyces sp. NBC_00654]MCX4970720.1 hypothetical protein [Streptomyces sp. NBC_00654]